MARKKRYSRSRGKNGGIMSRIPSEIKTLGAGFLYEAVVKSPTENIIKGLTKNFGLNLTDNVVRIIGNVAGRRLVGNRMPFARKVFDTGLSIEGAHFGEAGFTGLQNWFGGDTEQKQITNSEQSSGKVYG